MTLAHASQEFFHFLGTEGGALLRSAVEALLLLLITYMVVSEHRRAPQRHLKYLIWAFLALSFQRLYVTALTALRVFGGPDLYVDPSYFTILFNSLELVGLVLIGGAFVYPALTRRIQEFRRLVTWQMVGAAALFAATELLWHLHFQYLGQDDHARTVLLIFPSEAAKLIVLALPAGLLLAHCRAEKYAWSTFWAFIVYAIGPLLNLLNLGLFDYHSRVLRILALPFPLFGIILFTRAIYLKLVDKSVLKQQQLQTEKKLHAEQELSQLKDEFLSIVGHELRTPLTSMNLYSSLLLDEKMGGLNAQQRESVAILKAEIQRLSALINDILDLSKLEHRKVKLRVEKVALRELVERSSHRQLAEQRGIQLYNTIPARLTVEADPDKLAQVVINLVSNAIKFTPAGGTVTISARPNGKSWELSVADTGPGIPKETHRRLFDKFYQAESYLTREKGGTGLGLAIVRSLVELHNGKVTVKSEAGKGSTFTVSIPQKIGGKALMAKRRF